MNCVSGARDQSPLRPNPNHQMEPGIVTSIPGTNSENKPSNRRGTRPFPFQTSSIACIILTKVAKSLERNLGVFHQQVFLEIFVTAAAHNAIASGPRRF